MVVNSQSNIMPRTIKERPTGVKPRIALSAFIDGYHIRHGEKIEPERTLIVRKFMPEEERKAYLEDFENKQKAIEDFYNDLEAQNINLKTCSSKKLLDFLGIDYDDKTIPGKLIIKGDYKGITKTGIPFSDLEIDEDRLFQDIVEIEGNASFKHSNAKSLGSLQRIKGNAIFSFSRMENLGDLRYIEGDAAFVHTKKLKSFNKLEEIGGNAKFGNLETDTFENLIRIGGNATFLSVKMKSTGKLEEIGGSATFKRCEIGSFENLQIIGDSAYFDKTNVGTTGNFGVICGDATFKNCEFKNIKCPINIGGAFYYTYSKVNDFDKIKAEGGKYVMCPLV